MFGWVIGQVAFWYTAHEVKPAKLVDKLIEFYVDLVTPGRGTGESIWWMRGLRTLEQATDRTRVELDIRRNLRDWDATYPEIHHELIVRWLCGAAASLVATTFYNQIIRSSTRRPDRGYYY